MFYFLIFLNYLFINLPLKSFREINSCNLLGIPMKKTRKDHEILPHKSETMCFYSIILVENYLQRVSTTNSLIYNWHKV